MVAVGPSLEVVAGSIVSDVLSALTNLGYPEAVARRALETVRKQQGEEGLAQLGFDLLVREALRSLA
jgi:Holliday junction resolvasome RuvABC DNA-binding subunit